MAVIGRIRQRSGLLIFLIGASIVGFLIMDATNSQFSVLKGRKDWVGKVNGEKIMHNDFTKKYEENVKAMEDQMNGQPMGDDQRIYLRLQTWNEMVNDIIFKDVYDKLGINVTPEEMNELATGENVSPSIVRAFKNPQTGQFDPTMVARYVQTLDQDDPGSEPGVKKKRWLAFESQLKKGQFVQKYSNLINKGLYVPTWMAEMTYNDQNRTVDFKYVQVPYTDLNDADVKVSDDDVKKYLDAHSAKYKQEEETRRLQYVTFDIAASSGDSAKIMSDLEEKRAEFAKGQKVSDDSMFVKLYSETPLDEVYSDKDKLFSPVKDSFFTKPVKSLVGPYVDGKYFKLAKISDRKMISDSVHVYAIKIGFEGINSNEAAAAKFKFIDSLYKQIDSLKGDFRALAATFSDDQISKMKGGDMGWIKQGEKDKAYNDLIFYKAVKGKVYKVPSQTDNAVFLVQVVEEKPSKMGVLVSYLSKEIVPSAETEKNIYANATNFASENQSEIKFKESAKKLSVKTANGIQKDAFGIEGLHSARELVKWAYDPSRKKGDVSSVFTIEGKHVVVMLENISGKGVRAAEEVKPEITRILTREKKYELLAKKIADTKAVNIDDLAAKLGKVTANAEKISFGSPSVNNSYEPKVVAAALATAPGKLSAVVEGASGVFVVQTTVVNEPAKANDYTAYSFQMNQRLQNKSAYAQEAQKKLAKIEDNRFDFF